MKRLFVLLIFGLVVFVTPGTSLAQIQFLNNWTIDIDGSGGFDPATITEFIDIVGAGYIINSFVTTPPSQGDSGVFDEFSVFISSQQDSGPMLPWFTHNELTGIFYGSGTVELGGPLGFTGGTLRIFADLGISVPFATGTVPYPPPTDLSIYGADEQTLIAEFEVDSGHGTVDPTGVPNGKITVIFKATFLLPDVWVDSSGTDLSTMTHLVRGFSTTNASWVENPTMPMKTDLAGEFAGVYSPPNAPPGDMLVGANGQFRLFVEEEEEPGDCRVTAGGNKDSDGLAIPCDLKSNGMPDNNCIKEEIYHTWGGQAGAGPNFDPNINWIHHYKESNKDNFVFHCNDKDPIYIMCSDPGDFCFPARYAPYRQIDFVSVGQFNNKRGFEPGTPLGDAPVGVPLCFEVHLEDRGEPGPGGKWSISGSDCVLCPGTEIDNGDPYIPASRSDCRDCTDYYAIKIYNNAEYDPNTGRCVGSLVWKNGEGSPNCMGGETFVAPFAPYEGFDTRTGNVQMHPDNY